MPESCNVPIISRISCRSMCGPFGHAGSQVVVAGAVGERRMLLNFAAIKSSVDLVGVFHYTTIRDLAILTLAPWGFLRP